jgi:hypothetical protein
MKSKAFTLLALLAMLPGMAACVPQGTSNARHVATLAGLQTQRELCLVWRESADGRG